VIGTTGPNGLLALGFADAGSASLEFRTTSYSNLAQIVASNPSSDSGEITFRTRTGGSAFDRAKIDSSGRLLVGTSSSPTTGQGQYARIVAQGYNGDATGGGIISIQRGSAATGSGSAIGEICFGDNTGATFAKIGCDADATVSSASDLPGRLTFSTTADGASSPTERMRITNAGLVGIGTSSPVANLEVSGNQPQIRLNTTTLGYSGLIFSTTGTNDGGIYYYGTDDRMEFYTGDTSGNPEMVLTATGRLGIGTTSPAHQLQLSTDSAGKPSTNTWTIVSDERIKEEIELADLDICYEAIKNIPLKRFKWKDDVYTEQQVRDRHKLGWIAQDVEAVFPKSVGVYELKYNQVFEEIIVPVVEEELDSDGNVITPAQPERIEKGELISEEVIEDCRDLNADQLYAAMYGAIQKLISKVETLEAEVAALKAQ